MSYLAILFIPLCYAISIGICLGLVAGKTVGWKFGLLSGAVFFATSAFYGLFAHVYACPDASLFLIPFHAIVSASVTWSILSEHGVSLLALSFAGACLFSIPLKRILTHQVISHCQSIARQELNGERAVMVKNYKNALEQLRTREKSAGEASQKASEKEAEFNKKIAELGARENFLSANESELRKKSSEIYELVQKYNSRIDDETSTITELQRQLSIVSRTSERLKGTLGRVLPYKIAWKKIYSTCDVQDVKSYLTQVLAESKEELKNRENNLLHHSPRPSIPSLQKIP